MKSQTRQAVHSTGRLIRGIATIAAMALITTLTTPAAHAGLLDAAKNKVTKVRAKVSEGIGGGIGDRQVMGAIIDSAQPIIDLVLERKQEYDAFDAEAFRDDLLAAVDNIANMQSMLIGRVGPGISRLQAKLEDAHPMVLFALSETPLADLLDKTEGMAPELQTLVRITNDAIEHVESKLTPERVEQLARLGLGIAVIEYVSCDFVMHNISEDDVDVIKMSNLRAKQMRRISELALKVLPKSQTIGVNVVGGATVSIPNPLTPMTAVLEKATGKWFDITARWTKKYDQCIQLEVNKRLREFLTAQGY